MIYAINAMLFAISATYWSKYGALNVILCVAFIVAAVINGALSYPFVSTLMGHAP